MSQDSRDQFEQAYSEDNGGVPVEFLKLDRLGDSYGTPKVARAWYWWKRARAGIVVELPARCTPTGWDSYENGHNDILDVCKNALDSAGIKCQEGGV